VSSGGMVADPTEVGGATRELSCWEAELRKREEGVRGEGERQWLERERQVAGEMNGSSCHLWS